MHRAYTLNSTWPQFSCVVPSFCGKLAKALNSDKCLSSWSFYFRRILCIYLHITSPTADLYLFRKFLQTKNVEQPELVFGEAETAVFFD